jgi:hypothetical protein
MASAGNNPVTPDYGTRGKTTDHACQEKMRGAWTMIALAPNYELNECKAVTARPNSIYFESLRRIFRFIYCGWSA